MVLYNYLWLWRMWMCVYLVFVGSIATRLSNLLQIDFPVRIFGTKQKVDRCVYLFYDTQQYHKRLANNHFMRSSSNKCFMTQCSAIESDRTEMENGALIFEACVFRLNTQNEMVGPFSMYWMSSVVFSRFSVGIPINPTTFQNFTVNQMLYFCIFVINTNDGIRFPIQTTDIVPKIILYPIYFQFHSVG